MSLVLVAFAVNLPLSWWLLRAGRRWRWLDRPAQGSHKAHERGVPVTGGIGLFAAPFALVITGLIVIAIVPAEQWRAGVAPLATHAAGLLSQTPTILAILAGAFILHVVGLIDDRRPISAGIKLYIQLFVAAVLSIAFDMRVLQFLDGYGPGGIAASAIISILWMVTIINAINFLDNMDGLSGGVSAIIAGLYLAATLLSGQWFVAALSAVLLGALLAFLVFNFPPAKLFMGDGGSLVIGLLLAIISVRTTYYVSGETMIAPGDSQSEAARAGTTGGGITGGGNTGGAGWYGVLMPLVIMAVPLYDITSVTLIRLWQGKSPFEADQQHFSHRLVKKGLSKRAAVIVIWLCTLATGLGGVMLGRVAGWQAALIAAQAVAVLALLAMLERGAKQSSGDV